MQDQANSDILEIVNGSDGANAAKLTFLYQLATYKVVDKDQLEDNVASTFGDRKAPTESLNDPDLEHSAGKVKEALLGSLEDENLEIDTQRLVHAVQNSCVTVLTSQINYIHPNANMSNVYAIVERMMESLFTTNMMDGDTISSTNTNSVQSLDQYLEKARDVFDSTNFQDIGSDIFDQTMRNAIFAMYKPLICMHFLFEFVPEYEGYIPRNPDLSRKYAAIRRDRSFKPSYQEMQYARLAIYRAVFDLVDALLQHTQEFNSGDQTQIARLSALSLKLTETLGSDFVTKRKNKYPEWQAEVSQNSSDTKRLSIELYQANAQLEKRKANLLVMLQNQRELQKVAARKAWIFWITVIIFVLVVLAMISLLVFKQFFALYAFCTLVVVVPLMYLIVSLVGRSIRKS